MATYQPRDRYYRRAKAAGLPSRAAYKLEELLDRFHLVRAGARVIDLGCAPGGWLAILARAGARVVGVDLAPCDVMLPAVVTIAGDIGDPDVQAAAIRELGAPAGLITCDLSPKLGGIAERDQARSRELLEIALEFARGSLRGGGAMVAKLFMGGEFAATLANFKRYFNRVEVAWTRASRPGSAELYIVARGFRRMPAQPRLARRDPPG